VIPSERFASTAKYLLMRHDPEPELEQEVEEVRRALAEITGSR
jgi:hypothetical protein